MKQQLLGGFALLTVLLTGCGGALLHSSVPAETPAEVAGHPVKGNFFPLEAGRFLGFAPSETAFLDPKVEYSLEVVGPAPRLGNGVMEVADPETRSFLVSDKHGVRLLALAKREHGAVRRLARPLRLIAMPLRVGRVWTDTYGRGAKALKVRHWVADRLRVRTPAGTFDVFQIERRVWRGAEKAPYSTDGVGRWSYYYAPGVGPVQIGMGWTDTAGSVYQLFTQQRTAPIGEEPVVPSTPWRGIAAGLESLLEA